MERPEIRLLLSHMLFSMSHMQREICSLFFFTLGNEFLEVGVGVGGGGVDVGTWVVKMGLINMFLKILFIALAGVA